MGELVDELPPSIPPRPAGPSSGYPGGYSSIGSGYSAFSGPGLGNNLGRRVGYNSSIYDSYGSYGGLGYGSRTGYGYNQYAPTPYNSVYSSRMNGDYGMSDGGFLHRFEAAGRPAFEVIDSVVNAVGSVSMLLDSTHATVFSLFRSVIGVADEFARLKSHFSSLFTAFAFTKFLRWLRSKLSIRPIETAWENAQSTSGPTSDSSKPLNNQSNWPFIIFFSALIGAPYLTWKLLSSPQKESSGENMKAPNPPWVEGKEEHYVAEAIHDFEARDEAELSMIKGQSLRLAPKHLQPQGLRGWLLASSSSFSSSIDDSFTGEVKYRTGLVPANRIKVLGRRTGISNDRQPEVKEKPDLVQSSNKK